MMRWLMFRIERSDLRIYQWSSKKMRKSTKSMFVWLWVMKVKEKGVPIILSKTSHWKNCSKLRMRCMKLIFIFIDFRLFIRWFSRSKKTQVLKLLTIWSIKSKISNWSVFFMERELQFCYQSWKKTFYKSNQYFWTELS